MQLKLLKIEVHHFVYLSIPIYIILFISLFICKIMYVLYIHYILGDPEVTAIMYCNCAYLHWEGCVIYSIRCAALTAPRREDLEG